MTTTHHTSDVVVAFARYGVAIGTIARALVISAERTRDICKRAEASGELQMMPPELPTDIRSATMTELVHMRHSLDEARALIRELQAAQSETVDEFVGVVGFTAHQAAIVGVLAKLGSASRARIYDAMYGARHDDDQPDPKIVDVHICKCRLKLRPYGIEIGTLWAVGYQMTPENIAKLRALPRVGVFPADTVRATSTVESRA